LQLAIVIMAIVASTVKSIAIIATGCFTILTGFKNFIKQKEMRSNNKLKTVRLKTP